MVAASASAASQDLISAADAGMPGAASAACHPGRSAVGRGARGRARLVGDPRNRCQQAELGASAGHRLPAGRPVGQAMGQLGDINGVIAVRQQRRGAWPTRITPCVAAAATPGSSRGHQVPSTWRHGCTVISRRK